MSDTMPFEAQFYKAQNEIETLKGRVSYLEGELRLVGQLANDRLSEIETLRAEHKAFREALEQIAGYDDKVKHPGICDYGCDAPDIAQRTLAATPPAQELPEELRKIERELKAPKQWHTTQSMSNEHDPQIKHLTEEFNKMKSERDDFRAKLAEVERHRDSLIDSFRALREFIDGQRNDPQGIADIINGALANPPEASELTQVKSKLAEVERQRSAALAALEMWKLYFQCTDDEDAETHGERFTECWTTMEHALAATPPKGEAK